MTNMINQPWTPATAPRVKGTLGKEVAKMKPYNAMAEQPMAVPNNQGIPNDTMTKGTMGGPGRGTVGSTPSMMNEMPRAVPN